MDTIDGMKTFVAVVTEGSFTAAANQTEMSTALVSKYISQLEDRLGVRLLNRTTRSLTLTEVGSAYFDRCRKLLEEFDELEATIQNRDAKPQGTLIVSAPTTFGALYLAEAIAEFTHAYPEVNIDLRLTDRLVNLVEEGVDVAIGISELVDSTLIARRLAPARIVVCATPKYIAKHGCPLRPDDLLEHCCIVDRNFRNGSNWKFHENGKEKYVSVKGRIVVNNAESVRRILLADTGIALIPTFVIGQDIKLGRLKVLLPEYEGSNLGLFAIYIHNKYLAAKVRAFVDFCIQRFGQVPIWDKF